MALLNAKSTVMLLLLFLLIGTFDVGATDDNPPDSLIVFKGHIFDSITVNPKVVPLEAKIVLERLPYGSELGITFSNDSTGTFEYTLTPGFDYKVEISCSGYETIITTVKKDGLKHNNILKKDFYLKPHLKKDDVILLRRLIFAKGEAYITDESTEELDYLASIMNEKDEMIVQLEGHTDYRGNAKANMKLSQDRVRSVKEYLEKKGIDGKRIKTKAFGGTRPLIRDETSEGHSKNRRVEVRILKID